MLYPQDFPPESRSRVAAERLRAGKDFDHAREKPLPREYRAKRDLEAERRKYILRQFAVFVSEAGKLGSQRIWPVDRVEQASLEFLRLATIDAGYRKGFDKSGKAFAQGWTCNWGYIKPWVMREFERSGEWGHFQETLLRVAEHQEAGRPEGVPEMTRDSVGGT